MAVFLFTHHEFAPCSQMINLGTHQGIISCLRNPVPSKRPELREYETCPLRDVNASACLSFFVWSFLAKQYTPIVLHSLHSPHPVPANIFLFPKSNITLKGWHFKTTEEIQDNVTRDLCAVGKNASQDAFQK